MLQISFVFSHQMLRVSSWTQVACYRISTGFAKGWSSKKVVRDAPGGSWYPDFPNSFPYENVGFINGTVQTWGCPEKMAILMGKMMINPWETMINLRNVGDLFFRQPWDLGPWLALNSTTLLRSPRCKGHTLIQIGQVIKPALLRHHFVVSWEIAGSDK